jgi:hypothetical protein
MIQPLTEARDPNGGVVEVEEGPDDQTLELLELKSFAMSGYIG